ncbi:MULTISPECIES: potassium channel family protein [Rhodococcus]|nr:MULTISPECIES: potassium channel protein [Rhodococcus]
MRGALRARLNRSDVLTERPDFALVGIVRVPQMQDSPGRAITRRIGYALTALALVVLVVYLDRDGYSDSQDDGLSLLDCIYYATVSLSTTGYGDITPITVQARLVNILVITPLRIFFLIVLVGTTLSALTETSRQSFKIQRWRRRARNHTVVAGYGTKGRTAVDAMLGDGVAPTDIVVVDTDPVVLETAVGQGLVTVQGSATKSDVLRLAGAQHASSIIVATNRDDTAVLVTLTARELAPKAKIVAAIRESENTHLMRQSGADSVVISSETAGRLLGIAISTPTVVEMIEDLLTPESGLAIAERTVEREEIGGSPRHLSDLVLAVVRDDRLLRAGTTEVDVIEAGDKLLYIRRATDGVRADRSAPTNPVAVGCPLPRLRSPN